MQVRSYSRKISIPATEIIEILQNSFPKTNWTLTSELKDSHIDLLNQTFSTSENLPTLSASKATFQLTESKENPVTSNSTKLTATEKIELAQKFQESQELLATEDVQNLRTDIKATSIKESAQISAITDYQTYQDTYESTTREIVVNEIFSHLETQNKVREQFKSEQLLRQHARSKPQSKDLTSELLELWANDSNDFVNDLLKNIK